MRIVAALTVARLRSDSISVRMRLPPVRWVPSAAAIAAGSAPPVLQLIRTAATAGALALVRVPVSTRPTFIGAAAVPVLVQVPVRAITMAAAASAAAVAAATAARASELPDAPFADAQRVLDFWYGA